MALQSSSALFRWLHPFWNRTLYAFLECWNKEHGTPLLCTVCTALAGKFFTLQWLESCKWTCKPFLKSCTQVPIIKELYQKFNQSKKTFPSKSASTMKCTHQKGLYLNRKKIILFLGSVSKVKRTTNVTTIEANTYSKFYCSGKI